MIRSRLYPALAALLVLGSGCGVSSYNAVTGETTRGAYTWAQEVQIGQQSDPQIIAQYGLYNDPALQAYVEEMGQAVLQTSAYTDPSTDAEIRNTPFHFRLLDSPVVNAFALPGGYIYVTRGLMSYLENEAQLAVVLGHEIGHVLARHASRQALSQQRGQFVLLGGAIAGGVLGGGDLAQGILEYGSTGVQLMFLSYGREAERESDRAGVAYAEFAGYDAAEAARFFRSLGRLSSEGGGGSLPSFLSTHPDPAEREQTIPQLAAQYDSGTEVNTESYLARIENIVIGEDPRQGFVENNTFYHPELRFEFNIPQGWQVQNTAAAVIMQEPNGGAAIQMTLSQEASASAAYQKLAQMQGVTIQGNDRTSIAGNTAYVAEGVAQQQNGNIGFAATYIEYGGNVYEFLGLTSTQSYSQYRSALRGVPASFERLTSSSALNRQPSRLEVVTLRSATTLRSLLSNRTLPLGVTAQQMAIANEVELDTRLEAGTRVKLPR